MARKGKTTQYVNKVTDSQLIEAYMTMRSRDLNKKEGVDYLRQQFVEPSLPQDVREAVSEALYRKIFVRNEANPKAEGIIPRAIRRNQLAKSKLEKFETLTEIKTFDKLKEQLGNNPIVAKMTAEAERMRTTPQNMWRETVLTMQTQIPKLQAIVSETQSVLSACNVSEDGKYWTPGRAKADGLDDILYAKGDNSVPGIDLGTLSQLFNELSDE
ncbi:MAG: hypothetical protein RL634_235 [Bacteroidota bacterium]|jgi:hypothetical protein